MMPPRKFWYLIKENNSDERILTLFNDENLGVGGASMVGFKHAKNPSSDNSKIDGATNGFKIVK